MDICKFFKYWFRQVLSVSVVQCSTAFSTQTCVSELDLPALHSKHNSNAIWQHNYKSGTNSPEIYVLCNKP
jgi:hypothetical protein